MGAELIGSLQVNLSQNLLTLTHSFGFEPCQPTYT